MTLDSDLLLTIRESLNNDEYFKTVLDLLKEPPVVMPHWIKNYSLVDNLLYFKNQLCVPSGALWTTLLVNGCGRGYKFESSERIAGEKYQELSEQSERRYCYSWEIAMLMYKIAIYF